MFDRFVHARIWLAIALSYLVVSLLILSPVLTSGALHHSVFLEGDAAFPVWANGWVAYALSHFKDPFFSPDVWSPRGVNLLANTTSVGLAVLFAPITWLVGPVGSFNLQLISLPVASALAMCLAVRPWVKSSAAVWLAGLAWGFCPVALEAMTWGWPNFLYLATAPLLFWLLSDLVHSQRHSPRFLGISLSIVLTVQFTVGTEMLAIIGMVSLIIVPICGILALIANRTRCISKLTRIVTTLAWSAPLFALVLVPLLLFTLQGPAHLPTWVYPSAFLKNSHGTLSSLVSRPTLTGAFLASRTYTSPSTSYFGYVLLAAAGAAIALRRREVATWVLVGIAVVSCWLSMGSDALLSPWKLLLHLPVVHNIIEGRFIDLTWFAVIFLVVLGFDRSISLLGERFHPGRGLAVASLLPIIAFSQLGYGLSNALHVVSWAVVDDPAVATVAYTTAHSRLVTFPFPVTARGMIQESTDDFRYQLVGGWGPQVYQGTRTEEDVYTYFEGLTALGGPQLTAPELSQVGKQLLAWKVTDAVLPRRIRYPTVRGYVQPAAMIGTLTELYGSPRTVDGEWVWSVGRHSWHDSPVASKLWRRCVINVFRRHPSALPTCIDKALQHTT
jgi:hypothetical protein